jgi:sulfur carrier protein
MPPEDRSSNSAPRRESPDSAEAIRLFVNGEVQNARTPCSVSDLLETLEMGGRRVAVAVNREVVVRSRHAEVELCEGDRIEILEAVGGG